MALRTAFTPARLSQENFEFAFQLVTRKQHGRMAIEMKLQPLAKQLPQLTMWTLSTAKLNSPFYKLTTRYAEKKWKNLLTEKPTDVVWLNVLYTANHSTRTTPRDLAEENSNKNTLKR